MNVLKRISYDILGITPSPSSVAGMQLIIFGWVGECCSVLDTQLLFLSQILKNIFVGIFQDAARYKWRKKTVMVWAGNGGNLGG